MAQGSEPADGWDTGLERTGGNMVRLCTDHLQVLPAAFQSSASSEDGGVGGSSRETGGRL